MNEKVKSKILAAFAAMPAKVGDCLLERWIIHTLQPSLNPKEKGEIQSTINGMEHEGLITVNQRAGMFAMALSQAGYDAIYPTDPAGAITKIRDAILNQFSSSSSEVGHCIDERWIVHKLLPSLNPKEQDQVNPALQALKVEGIITTEKKNGMLVLILTRKGFDTIY